MLRVWLPLTKDLRNQGLDDVTITDNGATFNSAGKLGGCYKTSSTATIDLGYNGNQINTGSISFGGWFKFNQAEVWSAISGKNYTSTASSATGNLIGNNSYGGVSLQWWSNNIYTDGSLSYIAVQSYLRTTTNGARSTGTTAIPFDTWTHIFLTYNKDNNLLQYWVNGELKASSTQVVFTDAVSRNLLLNWGAIAGGNGPSAQIPFLVNDIRIYDHCLSPMEVKELSKGLVLHYPLNRQGWGQENILLNTGFDSRYTQSTGWDTTKNGTQLASSWGGYNGGVTNPSTVYHAHLKQVNGEWVYEYIRTANESWLGISQGGLQSKLTAGKTYTFSWEEYRVEGNNYPTGGLYYYKTGATSANFHLGQFGGSSGNILGKWRKFSYTFTAPTDGDYSKNMSWYIYGHSGGNGKMYMRHPKLEEGSIATPWCPNSSDALATAMGLNSLIEYDCSGFCNNSIYNSKPTVSSDTSKYNVSTYFGEYNTPKTDLIDNSLLPALTNCTITWWEKNDTTRTLLLTGQSTSHYIAASDNNTYYHGTVGGTKTLYRDGVAGTYKCEAGVWHHYALVGADISTWTALHLNGYGSYWYLKGLVSDLRIYATALSADDVKSLYQNSAYIDSSGNVYGAVHSEV